MKKNSTILVLACIALICMFALHSSAKINPGTIAGMWLFDEGSGDTAKDSSQNGNDGTITAAEWVDGYFGKALKFDGATAYVDVGDDESLNLVDHLTLMAWIKHEPGNDGYIIMRNDDGDMRQYGFLDYPGNQNAITSFATTATGREEFFYADMAVDDNEWHHLTVVYDNPEVTLYIDGVPKEKTGTFKELSGPMKASETTTLIGRRKPNNFAYKGIIDEVAIFSVGLSEDDIKAVMNRGLESALAVSSEGKLAASWANIKAGY